MVDHNALWAWPVWTPGAWLAEFIQAISKYCYTHNMQALDLMVSEKKFVFYVFPIVSLWELMTPGV